MSTKQAPKPVHRVSPAHRFRHGRLGQVVEHPAQDEHWTRWVRWRVSQASGLFFKGSVLVNFLLGIGKIVLGALSISPFVIVNGAYSIGNGLAKFFCLQTAEEQSAAAQHRRYRLVGVFVVIASLLYVSFAGSLFIAPENTTFTNITAITLATVVFVEIGVNLRLAIVNRRNPSPLAQASNLTGLAAALTSLTMVQMALRAIGGSTGSAADGWGGVFCGGLAVVVGLIMIILATRQLHRLAPPAGQIEDAQE